MAEEVDNAGGVGANEEPGTLPVDLAEMAIAFNKFAQAFIAALTPIIVAAGRALKDLYDHMISIHDEDVEEFHRMLQTHPCPVCEVRETP